jgi:hypothetical protein
MLCRYLVERYSRVMAADVFTAEMLLPQLIT